MRPLNLGTYIPRFIRSTSLTYLDYILHLHAAHSPRQLLPGATIRITVVPTWALLPINSSLPFVSFSPQPLIGTKSTMVDHTAPLASLSLTHVYYDPSDPVSYACAWLALVPQALCVIYVTLIWISREAEVGLLFAGQLACEAINFALKRLIKEERPRRIHGKGYGMPSSHAQFVAFWALSLALFLLIRHRPNPHKAEKVAASASEKSNKENDGDDNSSSNKEEEEEDETDKTQAPPAATGWDLWQLQELYGVDRYPDRPWSMPERALVSAGAFVVAGLVAWSRVYLGYHTSKQVFAGLGAGSVSAIGWFAATAVARQVGLVDWLLALPVARWFRLRDLVVEEDICQAGWEKWEQRRLAAAVVAAAAAADGATAADATAVRKASIAAKSSQGNKKT